MNQLLALLLALIFLLTGCGSAVTEVIPDEPEADLTAEEEPWAPETPEERLAYAFAGMESFTALEGEESLTFTGTIGGEPLSYTQAEFFNTSEVDTSSVTYYREVDWSALVGEEAITGSYNVSYESGSLVSRFESGTKESQKATAAALSKNIRAVMTARTDAEAAAHYTVLGAAEEGSEVTFTADESWLTELIDRSLTLMGEGYEFDLSGAIDTETPRTGEAPACRATLDDAGQLRILELRTGEQVFTLEDGTELSCSACYRLRIIARDDSVVPYIPGFT